MKAGENPSIYNAWQNMRRRCDDPTNKEYHCYGATGITYPEEWKSYENFKADMEPTWFEGASLDRRDNNLDYSVDNCRWVNRVVSNRNRAYCKMTMSLAEEIRQRYAAGGITQKELAKMYGVSRQTVGNIISGISWA